MTTKRCICGGRLEPYIYKYGRSQSEVRLKCESGWSDGLHRPIRCVGCSYQDCVGCDCDCHIVRYKIDPAAYDQSPVRMPVTSHLYDYDTADRVRAATADELAASIAAAEKDGGAGVIEVDGRRVYAR